MALFAVLGKREGCTCSCHCRYVWGCELKPAIAICVRVVPVVILGIHLQDWDRSGQSMLFCHGQSPLCSPQVRKGFHRL